MSKAAAIDYAVRRSLAADGKTAPVTYKEMLSAPPENPPQNPPLYYGYDNATIVTFLVQVANQLRLDTPALTCRWADLDLTKCLASNLGGVLAYLEAVTS